MVPYARNPYLSIDEAKLFHELMFLSAHSDVSWFHELISYICPVPMARLVGSTSSFLYMSMVKLGDSISSVLIPVHG
jgi:hypothetical protein